MAVWHFRFLLIPELGILKHHSIIPERLEGLTLEDDDIDEDPVVNYWEDFDVSVVSAAISKVLPISESWDPEASMFGDSAGNRVEIWVDNIACALDLRALDLEILESILRVARSLNLKLFVLGSKKVLDPEMQYAVSEIKKSSAYKFVSDPHKFLDDFDSDDSADD